MRNGGFQVELKGEKPVKSILEPELRVGSWLCRIEEQEGFERAVREYERRHEAVRKPRGKKKRVA